MHNLLTSWRVRGCTLPGHHLWLRFRVLVLILLGLASVGYAFYLVRTPETISAARFYWFFYSGALLIFGGLVEQGHNLERRADAPDAGKHLRP